MAAVDGWTSLAAGTAAPESRGVGALGIFQPVRLGGVLIHASNVDATAPHYVKLLRAEPSERRGAIPFRDFDGVRLEVFAAN